jgi:hypothetical protein
MNDRNPSRPPWETQGQPRYTPDDTWYGGVQGPSVVIKPHSHSARGARQDHDARQDRDGWLRRPPRRGVVVASVAAGLVVVAGISAAAFELTRASGGHAPAAANLPNSTPTQAPTQSAAPTPTPSASASSAGTTQTSSYVLGTPATAGGYTLTTPPSTDIKAVGAAGASALMTAVEAAGGKPSGSVSGEYLIAGDQSLGYAGYTGTFSPTAVLSAFTAGAGDVTTESAGPHGGKLACGEVTASAASGSASPGTACVWATATTVGMVEFFAGDDLEIVPHAKAASDTLNFRDDVETLTGSSASASPSATSSGAGTPQSTATPTPSA